MKGGVKLIDMIIITALLIVTCFTEHATAHDLPSQFTRATNYICEDGKRSRGNWARSGLEVFRLISKTSHGCPFR